MAELCSEDIRPEEIHNLLEHFSKNSYKVKGDQKGESVVEKCIKLFAKDYQYSLINNSSGDLCGSYPSRVVLLEYERSGISGSDSAHERVESLYGGATRVRELFKQARFARCRSRFAVPVLLYKGQHVCRSATLSGGAEMYSRSGLDFFMGGEQNGPSGLRRTSDSDMQMFDRVRGQDIHVLKTFNVNCICDLMVEKKKVKFRMNVTSSEKVDKENRYGEFVIVSMPYPGCEFFKEWKDNSYIGEIMKFDWNQSFVDACLDIPPTELLSRLPTDWSSYQNWNLIQLTQNYLKMLLHVVQEGDKGILIHCISGWDRTPMFISLLRLSLWADGAIHSSLSAVEILYLTLGYDWYLFGHNLSDRLSKGEEILLFCFYFLSYITSEEFSVIPKQKKSSSRLYQNGSDGSLTGSSSLDGCVNDTSVARNSSSGSLNADTSHAVFYVCNDEAVQDSNVPQRVCNTSAGCSVHNVQPSTSNRRSSPVEVPILHKPLSSDNLDSPCGSWQVLSSSGNIVATDSYSNPRDACSSKSEPHCSRKMGSCEEVTESSISGTKRWNRLDNVRRIFHNAYHNKITRKCRPETGITNLFDQFVEKVGIRPNKSFH